MNDISGDVACLYRILQRHYPQFMDVLKWQLTSREAFEWLVRTDSATLTDLERALASSISSARRSVARSPSATSASTGGRPVALT